MSSDASRLDGLEAKLAFQEDALQALNDSLVAQQARIDRLEGMLRLLSDELRREPDEPGAAPEPPPPHY